MTNLPDDPQLVYCVRTQQTGDKVYLIKDGTAAWIKNPETLKALGFGFGDVRTIPHEEFNKFERQEPIDLKDQATIEVSVIEANTDNVEPILGYRKMA